MTPLKKPIRRETSIPADHRGRNLIVELDPGPPTVIRFREKGRRTKIEAPLSWLFWQCCKAEAERRQREKIKKRKAKRGLLSI